jgi:predicted component of type VI protein secretion system
MRASDFIREYKITDLVKARLKEDEEDKARTGVTNGSIVTALNLIQNRIMRGELKTDVPTELVISEIQNAGVGTFGYQDLIRVNDMEPAIKTMVKNITPDTVTFVSGMSQNVTNPEDYTAAAGNPQDTVADMAKSAMKRRQG